MAVLVVGGAGYVGSHAVRQLLDRNEEVVIIDSLETGHLKAVPNEGTFFQGDIRDTRFLEEVFRSAPIESVMHFAAHSLVGESVEDPIKYYDNNVFGTLSLLKTMKTFRVDKMVFSSTAAVYGEPKSVPIVESEKTKPENPYGETKLAIEKLLHWCEQAYGIHSMILRYFNVAGAHPSGQIGEDHFPETHLIPIVLEAAIGKREKLLIYGDDYHTPDGTCIRDYIHVSDLAEAHVLALHKLRKENISRIYNLGNGNGFSVLQILEAVKEVTNRNIVAEVAPRRPGDPAVLQASSLKAKEELGWCPAYTSIHDIIASAWKWVQLFPEGYQDR